EADIDARAAATATALMQLLQPGLEVVYLALGEAGRARGLRGQQTDNLGIKRRIGAQGRLVSVCGGSGGGARGCGHRDIDSAGCVRRRYGRNLRRTIDRVARRRESIERDRSGAGEIRAGDG